MRHTDRRKRRRLENDIGKPSVVIHRRRLRAARLSEPIRDLRNPDGRNRSEMNPRRKLGIGSTGNAGVAAIFAMVETIEGIAGCIAMVEAHASLEERGILTEMPFPGYAYVRISAILHERMGKSLYNDWVDGNLDGLTHVARQGGEPRRRVIHMPTAMVLVSIPHEVCARSRGEMRYAG